MGGDGRLALEHGHAAPGAARLELARDGQAEDAGADDGDVGLGRSVGIDGSLRGYSRSGSNA